VTETETETVRGGIVVWKDRSWIWRRRDEERGDLDLSGVHVRRSHYRVVLIVDPVEGTERVRGNLTSHLGISVAHDRVPYFDGTTAFEYIYPYRALGKGARILPKEFKKSVGISVHVEFHLSLFQNLELGFGDSMLNLEAVVYGMWLDDRHCPSGRADEGRSRGRGRRMVGIVVACRDAEMPLVRHGGLGE